MAVVLTNTHTFFDTSLSSRWLLAPLSLHVLDLGNLLLITDYGKRKINFRVQKLGRYPLTDVFKVNTISDKFCGCHIPADMK